MLSPMELARKNLLDVKKSEPEQGTDTSVSPLGTFWLFLQPTIRTAPRRASVRVEKVNRVISIKNLVKLYITI
jgi:hypothetical protein